MICADSLPGNVLQLNLITFYSHQCISQPNDICKIQLLKQLKNIFRRMLIIPINIQFDNNRFKSIAIKICTLRQIKGNREHII
jgi:hypothetical protein